MGPFDNQTGKYVATSGYGEGSHWYLDEEGRLYIVPSVDAEIEGPESDVLDALNKVYRDAPHFSSVNPEEVAEELAIEVIPDVLKRFDPDVGYYRA